MILNLLLSILLTLQGGVLLKEKLREDASLVAPGTGSEKIILGDNAETVIKIKGYPDSVAEFDNAKDLFSHVFRIDSSVKILFTKIYYYTAKKYVVFLNKNTVSALAGLGSSGITPEAINLERGIGYFIFGYGNNELAVLSKSGDRKGDKIYIYQELGIALADDGDDDVIDMYIVFPDH